jgi:hypothetical protein
VATILGNCNPTLNFSFTTASGIFAGQALQLPAQWRFLLAASGVIANQCDLAYAVKGLTLPASTNVDLDLTSLLDPMGGAVAFARVRFLARRNAATTDGYTITEGGATFANQWTAMTTNATLYPSTTGAGTAAQNDGFAIHTAPNTSGAVVGGSSKILRYNAGANANAIDLFILGCSS